jgi:beta-ribofuranosylaminobenzene 5'-phosphate synthase
LTILHSFPRIHIGLLDLGNATLRDHGGAGFCIDGLPVEIAIRHSRSARIVGLSQLDRDGQCDLRAAIERMRGGLKWPSMAVRLSNVLPQHVGLGSKTATILGVLKGLDLFLDSKLDNRRLQELSGRGGTSGIGVNTFFTGGFVVDCGHATRKEREFAPSSQQVNFEIPPLVCRIAVPDDWCFYLFVLPGRRVRSKAEANFFRANTPIPRAEVLKALSLVYHGVVPAVISADQRSLKNSLRGLQRTGFKLRELQNQTSAVRSFIERVDETTNLAVGMSSLGPLVYAIGVGGDRRTEESVRKLCAAYRGQCLGSFPSRNRGFEEIK